MGHPGCWTLSLAAGLRDMLIGLMMGLHSPDTWSMDKLVAVLAVVLLVACGSDQGADVDGLEQVEPELPAVTEQADAGTEPELTDSSVPAVVTLAHDSSTLSPAQDSGVRADAGTVVHQDAGHVAPAADASVVTVTDSSVVEPAPMPEPTADASSPVVTPEPTAPVIVPPVQPEPVTPPVVTPPVVVPPAETQCLDQAPLTSGVPLFQGGVWNCMTNSAPRCAGYQACQRGYGWVMPAGTQVAYWGRSGNVSDLSYPFLASGTCAVAKGLHATCLMTTTDMTGPQTVQVDMVREPLMGWVNIVTALQRADGSCPLTCS